MENFNLQKGIKGHKEIIVSETDTASKFGSGLINVYATPAMVGLMETTAQESVQKHLPSGYITLGIELNIKHLKATPVGMKVRCESELIHIDGKKLIFNVDTYDDKGKIGEGTHSRFIVETKKFLEKLNQK